MKTAIAIIVCVLVIAGASSAQSQASNGDCPCKVLHDVTTAGDAPQTVRFTQPFALLPACTAAFVNRGETLVVEGVSRTAATVRFPVSGPGSTFRLGDAIELTCTLTNRRH